MDRLTESLPVGYYLVGDAAYMVTEHMITPLPGSHAKNSSEDSYNFTMSCDLLHSFAVVQAFLNFSKAVRA